MKKIYCISFLLLLDMALYASDTNENPYNNRSILETVKKNSPGKL